MTFRVTWPAQMAANKPPEEYATESRAQVRARELVAMGAQHAVVYEIEDSEGDAA